MADDRILVDMVVNRRYRAMSPLVQRVYVMVRELLRIGVAVAVGYALFRNLEMTGVAAALTLGTLWLLVEPWRPNAAPGTMRVLLTESGIYILDDGLYCDWEDVAFHAPTEGTMVFEPSQEAAPRRLFRSRRRVIPLGRTSKRQILDLFAERAGKRAE